MLRRISTAVVVAAMAGLSGAAVADSLPGVVKAYDLDMGTKRVNWNNAKWNVTEFAKPMDLSKFGGLKITVSTDKPRGDAGVYLALREESGTWHYLPWACNLTQAKNSGLAKFEDFTEPTYCAPDAKFQDDNDKLDLDKITAVAVGCINPFGVGKVSFKVEQLEPVAIDKKPAGPVKVEVTGKLMDVNGTTTIPAGVFGGFNVPPGSHERYRMAMDRRLYAGGGFGKPSEDPVTHMLLHCYGDRGQVPAMLTNPNWAAALKDAATKAATVAKETGKTWYVEWWNEPYLNWSNKNRMIFNPAYYDQGDIKEGGEVKLKADGSACPHLKWTQNFDTPPWNWNEKRYSADDRDNWRRGKDDKGKAYSMHARPFRGAPVPGQSYQPATHPPKDLKDGEKYKVTLPGRGGQQEMELTAFTPWYVYDDTQFTYWSSTGVTRFYNEPMLVAARAIKAAYPEKSVFIAGWGFRALEDHWAGFTNTYQPTIDAGIEFIDGVYDHDYGGEAIKMSANYEFLTGYGMIKHKKWLYGYNTETASGGDPEAMAAAEKMSAADQYKFTWTARKIVHLLYSCPDKVRGQAWFGRGEPNAFSPGGEGVLLTILKNLRGKLVQINCNDPQVYAVAAIDGADPQNPRPQDMEQRKELVVCVLNNRTEPREVEFAVAAPAGTKFGDVTTRRPKFTAGAEIGIEEKTEKATSPASHTYKATLAPHSLVTLTLPLSGEEPAKAQVQRRQTFCPSYLADVTPEKPLKQTVELPADQLKAKRAWVRIVAERLADGEGVVTVNGQDFALPAAVTPENAAWVREVEIPVTALKASNEVTFKVTSAEHAGYLVAVGSIVTETE